MLRTMVHNGIICVCSCIASDNLKHVFFVFYELIKSNLLLRVTVPFLKLIDKKPHSLKIKIKINIDIHSLKLNVGLFIM